MSPIPRRYLRCLTCMKRATHTCKTIIIGQGEDFRGISLYTRINGCASHSAVKAVNPAQWSKYDRIKKTDHVNTIVVGIERLSENVYKVWYQDFRNELAVGDQYHALLTRNEYEFTMIRERLMREYKVPTEYIEALVCATQLVNEDERNGISWKFYTEKMISV